MQIRVHTPQSLRIARRFGLLTAAFLSAALLAPPAFAGSLISLALGSTIASFLFTGERQWRGAADFGRVTPAERRAFIVSNTAWGIAALAALGGVFYFALTAHAFVVRTGIGHLCLLAMALAFDRVATGSMEHAARVCPEWPAPASAQA